jgi:hypothetical protein
MTRVTRHQDQGYPVKNREQALPNMTLHICQQLTLSIPSMLSDSVPILKTRSLAAANSYSEVTSFIPLMLLGSVPILKTRSLAATNPDSEAAILFRREFLSSSSSKKES